MHECRPTRAAFAFAVWQLNEGPHGPLCPCSPPFNGTQLRVQFLYFTAPCSNRCAMSLFTLRISSEVAVQNTGLVMQW